MKFPKINICQNTHQVRGEFNNPRPKRLGNRLMDLFALAPPCLIESLRFVNGRTEVLFHLLGRTNISFSGQQIHLSRHNKYSCVYKTNVLISSKKCPTYSHVFHFLDLSRVSEQEGSGKGGWNYFFY